MKLFKKMLVLAMAFCLTFSCLTVSADTPSPTEGNTTVTKKADKITVKSKLKRTIKKSKLKKKNITFKLSAKTNSGKKVTYTKMSGCKYIKVSKSGKVTVNKKLIKECKPKYKTYKVKKDGKVIVKKKFLKYCRPKLNTHVVKVKITTTNSTTYKKTSTIKKFRIVLK